MQKIPKINIPHHSEHPISDRWKKILLATTSIQAMVDIIDLDVYNLQLNKNLATKLLARSAMGHGIYI